ncbi:MAG: DUF1254 domain-containing protein [Erythrobacter sp.]|uniref:DUF1254 domain-containing protein n=1 Tax=Erythrobacter sp. TaxID=1042 RepID=UPI0025CD2085|nr:DUF1254 domain-containing protein [Erythrobacter sp.]MCL9998782.1 DUF1254 domain-containing protein [Erythrobacter sp.]
MKHLTLLIGAALLGLLPVPVAAQEAGPAHGERAPEALLPANPEDRAVLLRSVAFQATIYGLPAVLQYREMHRQAIAEGGAGFSGFGTFIHERELAGPGYAAFKVPNSDTLYSTAWLDLARGPVEVQIPPTRLRYYTLNHFDIHGNPGNLGTRTVGSGGGRLLLTGPGWEGDVPEGLTRVRMTSQHVWILMRVFAQTPLELEQAHAFQDAVRLRPRGDLASAAPAAPVPPAPGDSAADFLRALDYVLASDGHLPGEEALIEGLRTIPGLGSGRFDMAQLDPVSRAAVEAGHAEAMRLVSNARSQLGRPTGTGWTVVAKGNYGHNYLRRAINNLAGLGANVREENASFNTFVDAGGEPLDGAKAAYRLHLPQPPPVDAFWSVTLYDARTFELHPNPVGRYLVSDRTPGLKVNRDGSVDIVIRRAPSGSANWLPAPAGPFFLVIRSYLPKAEVTSGAWLPPGVIREP